MTAAHWWGAAGWALFVAASWLLTRVARHEDATLKGWNECLRLLEQANAFRRAELLEYREELKRREWACLALLARQHRDGKHDGEDFRTCERCREVAAEVGAGKA